MKSTEPDPYTDEPDMRLMLCDACEGSGHKPQHPLDYSRAHLCDYCGGTGTTEVWLEPVTLDDLEGDGQSGAEVSKRSAGFETGGRGRVQAGAGKD